MLASILPNLQNRVATTLTRAGSTAPQAISERRFGSSEQTSRRGAIEIGR